MRFHTPLLLLLAVPWMLAWALFARRQRQALDWIFANVSERFRGRFSAHSPRSLRWHLRLLAAMGLLLVADAAGPYLPGAAEIEAERARVLLLIDGSASMFATDVEAPAGFDPGDGPPWNRFMSAKKAAVELVDSLPEASFAIASFSGSVAVHSPMSADRTFLLEALRVIEVHGQYQRSGSFLAEALDSVFRFQDETRPNLQAVILGDGEQPQPEDLDAALEALAAQRVPVHTLGIGSVRGQRRKILDYRDLVAGKEEPAVLRTYETRRVDTELRRISRATGGTFGVLGEGVGLEPLIRAIREHRSPPARIERRGSGVDLAYICLLGFLLAFLADRLLIGRRPRHQPAGFDLDRIGRQPPPAGGFRRRSARAAVALLVLIGSGSCGDSPRARALRENEAGIALDALGRHRQARVHYRRSMGYGVDAHIPAFNLARSVHEEGDYSQAHDDYQKALEIDPRLPEAYYNDGIALYDWGEAERDPKGCQLERTRELWTRALERFARAVSLTRATRSIGRRARANHGHLREQLAEVERLILDPPPECLSGGGGAQGGGGGEGESEEASQGGASGQGGGGGGGDPDKGGGSGGQGDDPDQGGGSGGGGDDPDQGGGGGGQGDDPDQGGGGGGQGDDPDQGGGGGGQGDDPDQGGGGGSQGDDPDQGGGGGGRGEGRSGGPPLGPDELEQIRQELDRIGRQALEPGKYHRRTLPEQFSREHWANPDRVIWW